MHSVIFFVCLIPSAVACSQYIKIKRSIKLLNELKAFFEQVAFVLGSTAIEIVPLLTALQQKGCIPVLCEKIKLYLADELTFEQAWEKSIRECGRFILTEMVIVDIASFGKYFGFGNLANQLVLCSRYAAICSDVITETKTYLENNGKLSLTCSALFGLFIYIVLA